MQQQLVRDSFAETHVPRTLSKSPTLSLGTNTNYQAVSTRPTIGVGSRTDSWHLDLDPWKSIAAHGDYTIVIPPGQLPWYQDYELLQHLSVAINQAEEGDGVVAKALPETAIAVSGDDIDDGLENLFDVMASLYESRDDDIGELLRLQVDFVVKILRPCRV